MKKHLFLLIALLCAGSFAFAQKQVERGTHNFDRVADANAQRVATCVPVAITDGFTGDLDPANWILDIPMDGSFVPAGNTMVITGPNEMDGNYGNGSQNSLCFTAPYDMEVAFDWAFANNDVFGDGFDFFGYFSTAEGAVLLSDADGTSGSAAVFVSLGETFCFLSASADGEDGEGIATVTNFKFSECDMSPVPTMTEWGLFLFGLGMLTLGLVFVYNKQRQLA